MSSNFLSTLFLLEPSPDLFTHARVGPGLDREVPHVVVREPLAFYRIFLRHDYRQTVAKADIRRPEAVMVGERMLDGLQPQPPQGGEKQIRMAAAGPAMHGFSPKRTRRGIGIRRIHAA